MSENPQVPQMKGEPGGVRFTLTVTRKSGEVEHYDMIGTLQTPEDSPNGSDPHDCGP